MILKIAAMVCFVLLLAVGCTSAATFVVTTELPACTAGDFYCDTIQKAVDMAEDGDTIIACPGMYIENIEVNKSVSIRSYGGASDTIVEAKDVNDEVITITANKVNLSGFTIRNSDADGIYLNNADDCKLLENNIYSTRNGVQLFSSKNNTISHNKANFNNLSGILLAKSSDNFISNNTASSNKQYDGIELYISHNNRIIGNNASNNLQSGIRLVFSVNNIVRQNKAFDNLQIGIFLSFSSSNAIIGNNGSNNLHGIALSSSLNNSINGNNASKNVDCGIMLSESHNNIIKENTANSNKNYHGVELSASDNNILIDNDASNNSEGGITLVGSNNNIIRRNKANFNKQYSGIQLQSSSNNNISDNVALYNSVFGLFITYGNNNTIFSNVLSSNLKGGVYLIETQRNNIQSNIINSNSGFGVDLQIECENNDILNNMITQNQKGGLYSESSRKNGISNNFIDLNHGFGLTLLNSNSMTISGNSITSNYREGIHIDDLSKFIKIYHNNIINNAVMDYSLNSWYNNLVKEGNYWSDYNGADDGSGTGKHAIAGDGIGDTKIPYPEDGYDFYPFMNRDGWLTMSIWPHYLNFGKVYQGTLVNQTLTITNYENTTLNFSLIPSDPSIEISKTNFSVNKREPQNVTITLNTEKLDGFVLKNIEIISNDAGNMHKNISILGFVEIPTHDIEIKGVDYQSRLIKGQINLFKVSINNTGDFREKNVSIEFKAGDRSLGNTTITNIESKENKSAIFKWDTTGVAPKTYDITIEVKLEDKPLPLATLQVPVKVEMPSAAQTLILTNKEKLTEAWGAERTEKLENELIKLSDHVSVAGIPVYVEEDGAVASAYESWDSNLRDPQIANDVAKHIKERIDAKLKEYTGIRYIIIVGDDRIIPYYRISDNTDKPFRPELWQTVDEYHKVDIDSAVGSAFQNKMFLTDNIYATDKPMEWKTADVIIPELFVPDVPIGRLVESPEDISAVIAAFYQKEYVNPDRIFVTGYDFMSDSASDCSSTLENKTKGTTTTIISQKEVTEKYFEDIKDELLNTSNNIVLLFQHAEHDLFNIPKKCQVGSENITSQNISTATGLNGSIVCSLGCHSGLNVPPNASTDDFDLAQAFAQKGVLAYIAPTSYSIGLQRAIGAHELLITYFTQYLCEGMDVGSALTRAKQEYWATNYDISYIDEQVLETTTLYGLPMARINIPRPNTYYNESGMKIMSFERGKPDILVISPTYSTINISTMLTLPITYYKSESGELFLEPNAPVQPKEIRVFYPTPTRMLHGAVLTSAKYTVKSIIPLIDAYMQSPVWIGKSGSPVIDNWCPAQIFKLKSFSYPRAPMESRQYLIVVTGQYKGPTRVTPSLTGREERLYDELSFQLYYASPDEETKPPEIKEVSSNRVNDTINITVNVWDKSGIQRVLVTYTDINGGWGEWRSNECKHEEGDLWACGISAKEGIEFFVQAVDKNGNVAVGNV